MWVQVLSHLSSPKKTQLKDDSLNVSLWMQSLSSFCGNLYKKYPTIELVGLLRWRGDVRKLHHELEAIEVRDLMLAGVERAGRGYEHKQHQVQNLLREHDEQRPTPHTTAPR